MTPQKLFNRIKKFNSNRTFITNVHKTNDSLCFEYNDPADDNYYTLCFKLYRDPIFSNHIFTFNYKEYIHFTLYFTNKETLEHDLFQTFEDFEDFISFDSMEECAKNCFNKIS